MKASELRIGNWVIKSLTDERCQIYPLGIVGEFQHEAAGSYGDYKPIPLTPEWLERFGFVDEGSQETKHHGNFYSRHILDYKYCFAYADFRDDWGFYQEYIDSPDDKDEGKKYFVSCGIKHVHQLQNLYFALTGEELTINEPVEK